MDADLPNDHFKNLLFLLWARFCYILSRTRNSGSL
jgi:hypothetical protein